MKDEIVNNEENALEKSEKTDGGKGDEENTKTTIEKKGKEMQYTNSQKEKDRKKSIL